MLQRNRLLPSPSCSCSSSENRQPPVMGCFPLHLLLKACRCEGRPRSIKVMTMDGRCLRFDAPAIVKEVLMEYPRHALFLSDSVRSLGARARPLPSTSRLQPRHVYFLVPQPTQIGYSSPASDNVDTSTPPVSSSASASPRSKASGKRKVTFALSAANNGDLFPSCGDATQNPRSAASVRSLKKSTVEFLPSPAEGVMRLKMVVSKKQLDCLLRDEGDCISMVEGLLSPLLREAQVSAPDTSLNTTSDDISSWRPSLSSIPESSLQIWNEPQYARALAGGP